MPKDAIIVLGENVHADGSLPLLPKYRVAKGVELYKQDVAPLLLLSGKWSHNKKVAPKKSEARAMRDYARSLGVPEKDMLLDEQTHDTISGAYYTKTQFAMPRKWKEVVIVTSDFHIPRVKYTFGKVYGDTYNLHYASADSKLSVKDQERKKRQENALFKQVKLWLDPFTTGDHAAVREFLQTDYYR